MITNRKNSKITQAYVTTQTTWTIDQDLIIGQRFTYFRHLECSIKCILGCCWLGQFRTGTATWCARTSTTSSVKQPYKNTYKTRLLGHPQPQMYPPVALNQYTWVNRTHKHFLYMLQGLMNILNRFHSKAILQQHVKYGSNLMKICY